MNNPIDLAKDVFEAIGRERLEEILLNISDDLKVKYTQYIEEFTQKSFEEQIAIIQEYIFRAEEAQNESLQAQNEIMNLKRAIEEFKKSCEEAQESANQSAQNATTSAETAERATKDAKSYASSAQEANENSNTLAEQIKRLHEQIIDSAKELHQDAEVVSRWIEEARIIVIQIGELMQTAPTLHEDLLANSQDAKIILEKLINEILPNVRRESEILDILHDEAKRIHEDLRDIQIPKAQELLNQLKNDIIPRAEALIGTDFENDILRMEALRNEFSTSILPNANTLKDSLAKKSILVENQLEESDNAISTMEQSRDNALQMIVAKKDDELKLLSDTLVVKTEESLSSINDREERANTAIDARKTEAENIVNETKNTNVLELTELQKNILTSIDSLSEERKQELINVLTASTLKATVPTGLTAESNTQSILQALFNKSITHDIEMGSNSNGTYAKFQCGLLIQWMAKNKWNNGNGTVYFPLVFSNTNYSVTALPQGGYNSTEPNITWWVGDTLSKEYLVVKNFRWAETNWTGVDRSQVFYIAIGHWK